MEKFFRRDKNRKILGGVCSGIARFTGTDPILWKLLFIFGALVPCCPSILIYLLMWIIVPEE